MTHNAIRRATELSQSIWLDFLRRHLIKSAELRQLIEEDGLRGVTSNPKIFQKAIGGSNDYDESIAVLAREGKSVEDIYQALTVGDVRKAADEFRAHYDQSDGRHGFVSLEVSPHLARQTGATIDEARKLWRALDRPNVFIKVPATREGLPAIQQLIAEGINVNVTLLFGLPRYREVADAYLGGLEQRAKKGEPIDRGASVASFFLSRIDVLVDDLLERKMKPGKDPETIAQHLHGEIAIACARVGYQIYKEIYGGERFQALAKQGARTQRLLWASTSTKNPDYSDVKYVDALIGPETINTLPRETLDAFRNHGHPGLRLEEDVGDARQMLEQLADIGIHLDQVTQQLEDEGIEKFVKPFDKLMQTLRDERERALDERPARQVLNFGDALPAIDDRIAQLKVERFTQRLWRQDPGLWKDDTDAQMAIRNGLGWLCAPETMGSNLRSLDLFVQEVCNAGFQHVVHMGMGGSSLAPLAFERIFRDRDDGLSLTVLDTTDPATIREIENRIPLANTLFIVASKSGTTTETRAFGDYFFEKVRGIKGDDAGENFIAITDRGTPLADLAAERDFRHCFINMSDIGGRFSALSYFGLVPAALLGVDVEDVLARALLMAHACSSCVPIESNPGILLGTALGEFALQGRDKISFLIPPGISVLGMWLEQLIAESTGKEDTGLIPIADEPIGEADVYEKDRLFVHFRLQNEVAPQLETRARALEEAGHPVIRIVLDDRLDIAQEFFRWEIAIATAGAILGINPFDQPNVQESKDNTSRVLNAASEGQPLPETKPAVNADPLAFYIDTSADDAHHAMEQFFAQAQQEDYVALMAYVQETDTTQRRLQHLRSLIRDQTGLATTLGYGPRFLHSTGQLHKGGPNSGLFIQFTADDAQDAAIPGRDYGFATLRRAQALGDLKALRKHGRRVMRIHLGSDVNAGLDVLGELMEGTLTRAVLPAGA
jgi:transaldolase/glucose-6-phosphate isomerase